MLAGEHLGIYVEAPGAVTVAMENYCGFLNHGVKLVLVKTIGFASVLQTGFFFFLRGLRG